LYSFELAKRRLIKSKLKKDGECISIFKEKGKSIELTSDSENTIVNDKSWNILFK
jgi:hypothetical protein